MTDNQIRQEMCSWEKKYEDYEEDYHILSITKDRLVESINGLDMLYNSHHKTVMELVETSLGDCDNLKDKLQLSNKLIDSIVKETHNDVARAVISLRNAMDYAQMKRQYYYNQLGRR